MHQTNQSKSGTEKRVKRNRDVDPKSWYIVYIYRNQEDRITIKAIQKYKFPDPKTAELFIKRTKELKDYFIVKMKGKDINNYGIRLIRSTTKVFSTYIYNIYKYKYPPERITFQGMKSYRTKLRRQMRDHGKPQNEKFY